MMTTTPKALFDLTVLMDGLLNAEEPSNASATLLALAREGRIQGYVCAGAIEAIHDSLVRSLGAAGAHSAVQRICATLAIAPVEAAVIGDALALGWGALDDAITVASARGLGIEHLITLNGSDFDPIALTVQAPEQFLQVVQGG